MNQTDFQSSSQCRPAHPARSLGPTRCRGLTLLELVVVLSVLVALGSILVSLVANNVTIDLDGEGGQDGKTAQQIVTETTMNRVAEAISGSGGYEELMRFARDADDTRFVGYATGLPWPSPGEVAAGREDHPQLRYLFSAPIDLLDYAPPALELYDPVSRVGWRGPWLDVTTATAYEIDGAFSSRYGEGDGRGGSPNDDLAPQDGWGRAIVIQWPDPDNDGPDPDGDGLVDDPEERASVRLVSAGPNRLLETPPDVLTPTLAERNDDLVLFLYREDPNL
ncbi:MAG: hypothetical protein AAGE01_06275 [Pseudomonadota bacterium]